MDSGSQKTSTSKAAQASVVATGSNLEAPFPLRREVASVGLLLWGLVVTFFGSVLFLSADGHLENPQIPFTLPAVKDILWLALLLAIAVSAKGWRAVQSTGVRVAVVVGVIIFLMAVIILAVTLIHGDGGVDISYIRKTKNLAFYSGLTYVFAALVYARGQDRMLLVMLWIGATLSLWVGSFLFFFVEPGFKAFEPRMFGTYGNPNAVGFMALVVIALAGYVRTEFVQSAAWGFLARAMTVIGLTGTFMALFLSASFTALLGLLFYPVACRLVARRYGVPPRIGVANLVTGIVLASLITIAMGAISVVSVPIVDRMSSIYVDSAKTPASLNLDSAKTPVSFSVRANAYRQSVDSGWKASFLGLWPPSYVQRDATLINFPYNFGLLGAGSLVLPFLVLAWAVWSPRFRRPRVVARPYAVPLLATVLVLAVTNVPLQFQYEMFPTNHVFALLIALSLLTVSDTGLDVV